MKTWPCWCDLKIWHGSIITSSNFRKNKAVLLKWFENSHCLYNHKLRFSQRESSFVDVTWKFGIALLSRVWVFRKNKAVWLKWFDNLKLLECFSCHHTRVKIFSKVRLFVNMTWKFNLSLLSRAESFVKIRQFSWSNFKN